MRRAQLLVSFLVNPSCVNQSLFQEGFDYRFFSRNLITIHHHLRNMLGHIHLLL